MTRKRHLITLIVFTIAIATALTACRGRRDKPNDMDQATMERRALEKTGWMLDEIDADDAQRKAIGALVSDLVPEAYKLRDLRKPARETMARELLSGNPDAKTLHATVNNTASPLIAFAHRAADQAIAAHKVLSADQRAELAEEWEDRFGEDPAEALEDKEWMIEAGLERGLSKADANEAQYNLVFKLKDGLLDAVKADVLPARQTARASLLAELRSDNPDAAKIHATIDASAKVYQAFAHKAVDALIEVSRTLTPDQKAMIGEKMEKWRARSK